MSISGALKYAESFINESNASGELPSRGAARRGEPSRPRVLVAATAFDTATKIVYGWIVDYIIWLRRSGVRVEAILGRDVTADRVLRALREPGVELVVLMGHGRRCAWDGYEREPILVACDTDSLLAGRIVYSLSCWTAACLGPDAVRKGCKSFIGFDDEFEAVVEYASVFRLQALSVLVALHRGMTTCEAVDYFRRVTDKLIDYLMEFDDPSAALAIGVLKHNANHIRHLGECARLPRELLVRSRFIPEYSVNVSRRLVEAATVAAAPVALMMLASMIAGRSNSLGGSSTRR